MKKCNFWSTFSNKGLNTTFLAYFFHNFGLKLFSALGELQKSVKTTLEKRPTKIFNLFWLGATPKPHPP